MRMGYTWRAYSGQTGLPRGADWRIMMMDKDNSRKKHVNLSLTAEAHSLLKAQAMRSDMNVSQMVENWVRAEEEMNGMVRISRSWVKELDVLTLERLQDYCFENHTTPAEAVRL